MVQAAIGAESEQSELIFIVRDLTAKKKGYTSWSYIKTLERGLLPIYNGQVFQQDNAPIHTARNSIDWLHENGINVYLDWPAYSPDLNPIEHMWPRLKETIYQQNPELEADLKPKQQLAGLHKVLPRAWASIKHEIVQALVESMPRRIQAVIDTEGWHTKY